MSRSGNGLADALDNPTVRASVGHVSKIRTKIGATMDDQRDYAEEQYNRNLCPECGGDRRYCSGLIDDEALWHEINTLTIETEAGK